MVKFTQSEWAMTILWNVMIHKWSYVASPLPQYYRCISVTPHFNNIYGLNPSGCFQVYFPRYDTWETLPSLLEIREASIDRYKLMSLNGKLLALFKTNVIVRTILGTQKWSEKEEIFEFDFSENLWKKH